MDDICNNCKCVNFDVEDSRLVLVTCCHRGIFVGAFSCLAIGMGNEVINHYAIFRPVEIGARKISFGVVPFKNIARKWPCGAPIIFILLDRILLFVGAKWEGYGEAPLASVTTEMFSR